MTEAFRGEDGTPVDAAVARDEWTRAARRYLVTVARRYGALTTPNDVAEEAQAGSGIRTKDAPETWVGDVIDEVGVECATRNEPLLSAFCIGPEGRIGERYRQVLVMLERPVPADLEMDAAKQRLDAHEYHGATMPVDPRPALPPALAKARASAPKPRSGATRAPSTPRVRKPAAPRKPKKPEPPPRAVCPTCFLQLHATGNCDNCKPD
jgi:hypothetical protein